jgi:hypothetical protein
MAHVSHRLSNSFRGALAGGGVTDRVVQSAHCPVFAVTVLGFAADRQHTGTSN